MQEEDAKVSAIYDENLQLKQQLTEYQNNEENLIEQLQALSENLRQVKEIKQKNQVFAQQLEENRQTITNMQIEIQNLHERENNALLTVTQLNMKLNDRERLLHMYQ